MRPDTIELAGDAANRDLPKLAGMLLVFGSVLSILVLFVLDINVIFEPAWLLPVTNTLFAAAIPVAVSVFAAKTYLRNGSRSVLLMGCGMLSFGVMAAVAGWLRPAQDGANFNVTIYNTGALVGSLFHIAGAFLSSPGRAFQREPGEEKLTAVSAYGGVLLFIVLFSFATIQEVVPPFFVQGSGPTGLRQIVLGSAIGFYALSSIYFMGGFLRLRSGFLYWYSLCLAMLALGLFAFYIQKGVGSPIGWAGRTSNYVGAVFALAAILSAVRSRRTRGVGVEDVISSFFGAAEANYRALVETATDAIVSSDQEGRIILWNSSAGRIFGHTKKEAIGTPFLGLLIPERHSAVMRDLIAAPGSSLPSSITAEIEAKRKDGSLFPVEISAFATSLPSGRVNTCIVRDITGRRKMEEALTRSKEEWERTFRSVPDLLAILDCEHRVMLANPAMAERLGSTPEQCVGLPCYKVVHGLDAPPDFCPHTRTLADGLPHTAEIFEERLGAHLLVSTTPMFDDQGKLTGSVHIARDITERKLAEEKVTRQNMVLEAINRIFQGALTCETDEQLGQVCLAEAEKLTQSKFSFIDETGPDGLLHSIAISNPGWEQCTMFDKNGHRRPPGDFKIQGIYGRVLQDGTSLLTNDPSSHPESIGLPEGHPALTAFLGVPLLSSGKTVGMVGLGNREGGYSQSDLEAMEALAPAIVESFARKRSKEALHRYDMLAAHSRDIILFVQRDGGRILEANAAASTAYGYGREALLNMAIYDLRAPGTLGLTAVQMADADANGILFETMHQRKDGSTFPVEVSSRGATIGGVRTLVSMVRDITDRKRAEEALWESEALYRSLFDNMLNGLAHCRMLYEHGRPVDFIYLDVNSAFGALTGLENVVGKKVSEVIPGIRESDPELFEIYGRVALTGAPERFESYIEALEMWFSISVYSPQKAHFVAVFDVITERKKAEEALRESEGKFRSLFENMLEGVALHEMIYGADGVPADYRVLSTNPAFEKHTGIKPEQIEGKLASSVYGTGVPPYLEIFSEVVRSGRPASFETFFPPMERDFHISVTSPAPDRFVTVFEDITDQKRAEEALRDSEARFRLLSGTASRLLASHDPQGIVNELCRRVMEYLDCHAFFNFLVDEQAGCLHLNACAGIPDEEAQKIEWLDYGVAVCGCAARDAVRIVAEDIFHTPDVRTELVKSFGIQAYACHPLMAEGRLIGTLSFGTKTRTRFSPEDLALMKTVADQVAIAMERVRLIGALQASRDELEERVKERTAELGKANEELTIHATLLERSNRDLDDFAHVASHDLQEPLRKIQTFGAMLADAAQGALDEKARDYLERMQRSAGRMQSLVQDLLRYARLTSKPEPWTRFSLREPLDDALQDLAVLLAETEGRVEIGDLPDIEGDRILIRQLFQNLIGNGLKYCGKAKPVVRVYSRPSPSSAFWEIHVEDNGIGFDEDYLDKIFKPFERLHGRSAPYQGTGMGLAICRRIAERHRGSITARSKPGEGSIFIVKLPQNSI